MDRNPRKFDSHEIKKPCHTVLIVIRLLSNLQNIYGFMLVLLEIQTVCDRMLSITRI